MAALREVTVRDIWDLVLGDCHPCGGERGLDRQVEWVTALHATYPLFPELDRGHLAIARPEVARRLDAQLTLPYLIRELARADAAGLVIDEPPDEEACRLADELVLPLFAVPADTDLRALEREALRTLLDREGQEALYAARWRQEYQELLSQRGTGAVIERLADEFDVQACLVDGAGTVLIQSARNGGHMSQSEHTYPVAVTGRSLGALKVATAERAPTLLRLAATQAAEVCALEMIQTCVRRETEDQFAADLISDLLSATADRDSILSRLSRQGYDITPGRRHLVLALSSSTGAIDASSAVATSFESDLCFCGRREGVSAVRLGYQEVTLLLVSASPSSSDQRLRAMLTRAAEPLIARGYRVAVSRVVPDAGGLSEAVQQSLAGEKMGRRMNDQSGPLFYSDLGLYRLLLGLRDQAEVRRFYGDTLGRLVDYDREHNTELVATLRAYFEQNSNASETARRLYVHRNTLNYRLQRISEIIGLDLDSADTRLALQVALRIHFLGA